MHISELVGVLSPLNHWGLYQGWFECISTSVSYLGSWCQQLMCRPESHPFYFISALTHVYSHQLAMTQRFKCSVRCNSMFIFQSNPHMINSSGFFFPYTMSELFLGCFIFFGGGGCRFFCCCCFVFCFIFLYPETSDNKNIGIVYLSYPRILFNFMFTMSTSLWNFCVSRFFSGETENFFLNEDCFNIN